jgi:hypothetical protein
MVMASDQTSPSRRTGRRLCGAKTRAGGCCQVRAEPGKARCRFHGGKSRVRRRRPVAIVLPRPSANAGARIERGFRRSEVATNPIWKVTACWPEHASLHRNAITSDAVTRLWRRLSEAAVADRPKRTGNEGRCCSNNGSIRLTNETAQQSKSQQREAKGQRRATPPPDPWWQVLGVSPEASLDEISQRYRHAIRMYHPDRVAGLAPEIIALAERRLTGDDKTLVWAVRVGSDG